MTINSVPFLLTLVSLALALGCSRSPEKQKASSAAADEAVAASYGSRTEPGKAPPKTSSLSAIDVPFMNVRAFEGMLVGGQPSPDELRGAAAAGVKTIISLRTPSETGVREEAALAAELDLDYISIPVAGAAGLTAEAAKRLDAAIAAAQGPLIVHCGSGNRVGGLFAVRAHDVQRKSVDEALAIGKASGLTSLEAAVRMQLAQ